MDDQFDPRPVTPDDMERWEECARLAAERILPGNTNWPMMVLSLGAEVRKLRAALGLSQ
jgi:hypothetical protein